MATLAETEANNNREEKQILLVQRFGCSINNALIIEIGNEYQDRIHSCIGTVKFVIVTISDIMRNHINSWYEFRSNTHRSNWVRFTTKINVYHLMI